MPKKPGFLSETGLLATVQEVTMRRFGAWGVTAALLVGLSACVARGGEDEANGDSAKPAPKSSIRWSPFFARAFRLDESKPQPKPVAKSKKKTTTEKPAAPTRNVAAERSREEAELLRRLAVCDKLMEIAVRTNDNELFHRVEVLDERARSTYQQRTAALGTRLNNLEQKVKTVDKRPAAKTTSKPSQPDAGYSVTDNTRASRALGREINP
jgi:hypothetical protein